MSTEPQGGATVYSEPRVLVVCARKYNGHELWTALGVMQEAGIPFEVVSQAIIIEDEVTGQSNVLQRTVYDVSQEEAVATFTAIMIVSGDMKLTEAYWKDEHVLSLVRAHNDLNNPIAAICCSVPTIREATNHKEVSFFPLIRSKELLMRHGAILRTVALSVDGNLCTAEHQMASQMWSESFVCLIKGEPNPYNLSDSGYVPKGRPRKIPPSVLAMQGRTEQKPIEERFRKKTRPGE